MTEIYLITTGAGRYVLPLLMLAALATPAHSGCIGICRNCEICNDWITIEEGTAGFAGSCYAYAQRRPEVLDSICAQVASEQLVCEQARQLCLQAGGGGAAAQEADDCRPRQGPYKSKTAAIKAALMAIAKCAKRCKGETRELCGHVVLAGEGDKPQYYINVARSASESEGCQPFDIVGDEVAGQPVATYHNHPRAQSVAQENFSDFRGKDGKMKGDKAAAIVRGIESHLLTPRGVHKKFDPAVRDDPRTPEDERVQVVNKRLKGFKRCQEMLSE